MSQYTVNEMARLSGASVRALHHYDAIGLLKPAYLGANGYRYYGRSELLRLQQILFHRKLGLPLERIGLLLDDPGFDRIAALTAHRERLNGERERFGHLIATIDRTIAQLNGDQEMSDKDLYQGFSAQKQAEWEAEIVTRYGEAGAAKIAESKANLAKMSTAERDDGQREMAAINTAFAAARTAGEAPTSPRVQALAARHYAWVCRAWKPNAQAYAGMAKLYVDSPDFRAVYEAVQPGLTDYLAEAMMRFADTTLKA